MAGATFPSGWSTALDVAPATNPHTGEEGEAVTEVVVLIGGVALGAAGLVVALNMRAQRAERERWQAFQAAMRAGGRDYPLPHKRED